MDSLKASILAWADTFQKSDSNSKNSLNEQYRSCVQYINIRMEIIYCQMPLYTVYKLPQRAGHAQHFKMKIPLKIRQGTVIYLRINTNFVCSKR